MIRILTGALLLSSCALALEGTPAPSTPKTIDLSSFTLTFFDEFEGTTLDQSKWDTPIHERQGSSLWVPSLTTVKDGALYLAVESSSHPVFRFNCGAVRTKTDNVTMFSQRYGYWEARCKLPKNLEADYWAAFWIMSGRIADDQTDTRRGTEIDIMESFGLREGKRHHGTMHWGGYGKNHNVASIDCGDHSQVRDGEFHTYGLLWDEKFYAFYVDGVEVGRTDMIGLGSKTGEGTSPSKGVSQEQGYLKLSVEGSPWLGKSPGWDENPPKHDAFIVDYVRVYIPTKLVNPPRRPVER